MIQSSQIFEQIKAPLLRPVHPRGAIWLGGAAFVTILAVAADSGLAGLLLFLTGVIYVCFRNPARVPPVAVGIATAPADGILTRIDSAPWPNEAGTDGNATCLVIAPRFYDAHVLRAPASASLTMAQHITGQWGSHIFDKSAPGNERAVILFALPDSRVMAMEVIGGGAAERIRLSARAGDVTALAQEIGYAAFGGEVRLYLPDGIEVIAQQGQRMIAGETPVAAVTAAE